MLFNKMSAKDMALKNRKKEVAREIKTLRRFLLKNISTMIKSGYIHDEHKVDSICNAHGDDITMGVDILLNELNITNKKAFFYTGWTGKNNTYLTIFTKLK